MENKKLKMKKCLNNSDNTRKCNSTHHAKYAKCIIDHCRQNKLSADGLKLFRFPDIGTDLYSKWIEICQLSEQSASIKSKFLCSSHFRSADIGKCRLKKNACPSLKLQNEPIVDDFETDVLIIDSGPVLKIPPKSVYSGPHTSSFVSENVSGGEKRCIFDFCEINETEPDLKKTCVSLCPNEVQLNKIREGGEEVFVLKSPIRTCANNNSEIENAMCKNCLKKEQNLSFANKKRIKFEKLYKGSKCKLLQVNLNIKIFNILKRVFFENF